MTKNVAKVLAGVSQHFNFSVQQEPSSSKPTLAGSSKTSPATVSELNNQASQATQTKTRDTLLTLFKSQSLTSSSKVDAPNKESINLKGQSESVEYIPLMSASSHTAGNQSVKKPLGKKKRKRDEEIEDEYFIKESSETDLFVYWEFEKQFLTNA